MHENDAIVRRLMRMSDDEIARIVRGSTKDSRIARAVNVIEKADDEEIWRTTEEGKHFAIETNTGEVTKGNIGQKNISKPSLSKPKSSGGTALQEEVRKRFGKTTEKADGFHNAVRYVEREIDKMPVGKSIESPILNDPVNRRNVFTKEKDGSWTQTTYAGSMPIGRVSGWTTHMVSTEVVNNATS